MKYLLIFFIVLINLSCSYQNPTQNELKEELLIISNFEGQKFMIENSVEYFYQQRIRWQFLQEGEPLFAIRLHTTNEELPDDLFTDEEGWIYHYLPSADLSVPLSSPLAERSIWSAENEFEISFYSHLGELVHIIARIEIKYLLNDFESEPISVSFFDYREIGTILSNSSGNCDGKTIGTGTKFILKENIFDIFIEGFYAHHFMYRVNIVAEADSSMIEEGDWQSTIDLPDIRVIKFSPQYNNALIPNEPGEITQLEAFVVTLSGYSNSDNPARLHFKVQDGFYPNTLIYNGVTQNGVQNVNAVFALGENHHTTYFDLANSHLLPHNITNGNLQVATAYWIDQHGNNVFIGSDDFRVYMQYGWNGEYEQNTPFGEKKNVVLDEQTGTFYYTTIEYMDLRFDEQPLVIADLPPEQYNFTDDDGTVWLRVPKTHQTSRTITLSNLDYGEHVFQARAVDMQMAVDETPSSFVFEIFEPVLFEDKDGIVIIDDSPACPAAPEDLIDQFYLDILQDYNGVIDMLDRIELQNSVWNPSLHFSKDVFSPTDLQNYKLVIYHSDSPNEGNNLWKEYDVINLYLRNGGSMLLSGGKNLLNVQYSCINNNFPLLADFFGIPLSNQNAISIISENNINASFLKFQFFDKALPIDVSYNQLDLMLPHFYQIVSMFDGLGPVSYFTDFDPDCLILYGYGVKSPQPGTNFEEWDDIDDDDEFPSLNQFNLYNNLPVALLKQTGDSHCYIFGFPLSYMEMPDVRLLMTQILIELGM